MGRGTQSTNTNTLYGKVPPRSPVSPGSEQHRYCVTATVVDAPTFQTKMELAPYSIAPGYRFCKAPEEMMIEFYVHGISSLDAEHQFRQACIYTRQTPTNIQAIEA